MLCPKEEFEVVPVAAEVSERSWSVVARGLTGLSTVTGVLAPIRTKEVFPPARDDVPHY